MSKFYTASCQAKELCEKAKTAKEKAKELNTEVLLKKEGGDQIDWRSESFARNRDEIEKRGRGT